MKELSLFTGGGIGAYAFRALGWETVGYVEYNKDCQEIIRSRIEDGRLDDAPIYGDIRAFISEGYADAYKGMVDVITAGFPCQPFSGAGKRAGERDHRNMWPQTFECICRIRPRQVFLENVPALLWAKKESGQVCQPSYFGRVLGDLAEGGYDVKWRCLSASEVGAPHKRKRVWVLANANSSR